MKHHHPGVRVLLILVHLGWAAAVYHKPNAPLLLASYSRFDDMAPWHLWGWAALGIAFLMYFTRPGSLGAQLANFLSSIFFAVAAAVGQGVGFIPNVPTNTLLAFASLALWAADFRVWFADLRWVKRLVANPPSGWKSER
ncbi:hypothetical protein ACFSC4_31245 [Deinococcus malanensis]|uniref:hypothetical protein n=1 Tax=Deinococcus malanensis TaxID=1706855 RepID=UPI0036391566